MNLSSTVSRRDGETGVVGSTGRACQKDEEEDVEIEDEDEGFGATDFPDVNALANAPFKEDTSVANGSSIAFLAEYYRVHGRQEIRI